MIIEIRKTEKYALNEDERAGVANVERLCDGALTDWWTGEDATGSVNYLMGLDDADFDSDCANLEFRK